MPEKKLLSKKEACEYLGVSMYILRTLIKENEVPTIRVGTGDKKPRVFIARTALDQWLSTQSPEDSERGAA